jgi:hypothetical protein
MRDAPLTTLRGGINRLRTKGGARADSLYDFLNGYLTDDGTAKVRPGTIRTAALDTATRGLTYFDGSRHTFAASVVTVPAGYTLHVLVHPDQDPNNPVIALHRIHFAEPFLGFLYVVAEFVDGGVYHYWLQTKGTWAASTAYNAGDVIQPTVPNGIVYQASRLGSPNPSWRALTPYVVGDVIEPTVYNDFFYTVVETTGGNPTSGSTEPDWPEEDGARVTEEVDGNSESEPGQVTEPPDVDTPPADTQDRYGRPGNRGQR